MIEYSRPWNIFVSSNYQAVWWAPHTSRAAVVLVEESSSPSHWYVKIPKDGEWITISLRMTPHPINIQDLSTKEWEEYKRSLGISIDRIRFFYIDNIETPTIRLTAL